MSAAGLRVLIIEDDPAIARVLARHLERAGHTTRIAPDGKTATAAIAEENFDFVICDYQLPDALGEDVCRKIRRVASKSLPIALCTAKAHELNATALTAELGLTHIFSKPFSLAEISTAIEEVCAAV